MEAASDFDESLIASFERVAATFPSRVACVSPVWEPTYRELNETANRLAHRLIASGVVPGDRVIILMAHDTPLFAAVMGILKAGAIVVALQPGDPVSRLRMLFQDAEPRLIVTDSENRTLAAKFRHSGCGILNFESETVRGAVHNLTIEIRPEQTAFLTYTSGTTGRAKAVMKTHRQIQRCAATYTEAMQVTKNDCIPLLGMVSSGQGAVTVCWALLNGAMLCPFSVKTRGIVGLANWISVRGLTVYVSSASIFRTLVKTIDEHLVFANVRAVRLASESVTANDFRAFQQHFPRTSIFVHTLSSSETSNIAWSRWAHGDDIPEGVLPVGHFSRDMDVSLLDDDGQPVACGEVGEIVVKSRHLANGYWRDPLLTAERFSEELDGKGTRLVRTGDRGRINADGLLEFCGRKDDRIKIRGNRIELLDIERALEGLPGVDRVAVVAVTREKHEPVLVAFVVTKRNASWTAPRLRYTARTTLPLHMVPSKIVFLDSLPYNSGNKIDREALRQYSLPVRDGNKGDKPRTETEMLLAETWAEILDLSDIGQNDDFFSLGGDSLSGALAAARVHAVLGIELSLSAIAEHPTVSTLAAFIDECRRPQALETLPIVSAPRGASMPMSLLQEAIWNHHWNQADRADLTHVRSHRIVGPLDIKIFEKCLSHLIDRHEILRTTFAIVDGRPAQIIHKSAPLDLSFIDLIDAADPEAQAELIFREVSSQELNLEILPIRRHILMRMSNNIYRLIRISHPLVTDGFSSHILDAELANLYDAMLHGKELTLSKKIPLQYADYAVWQRHVMRPDGPYFNEVMQWWKSFILTAPPATRLPFRSLIDRAPMDPNEGVLQWSLEERTVTRLDDIARSNGATHFTIRLAAFVALIADLSETSTVVIGTGFANRNRIETQNIVGPFINPVHLVFPYDASRPFREWLKFVRDRVFEATMRSELPSDMFYEQLRASGIELPRMQFYFTMMGDHSDQQLGDVVISDEFWGVGTMPSGCKVYVDERRPEYCRVNFDANTYDRKDMRALLDQYLRLLEAVVQEPEFPIGKLLMLTRWDAVLAEIIAEEEL
jgi:amino acid adenylation domain-containing protein